MDFFQAQARAQKRTKKLVALFVAGVGITIAVTYFVIVILLAQINSRSSHHRRNYDYYYEQSASRAQIDFWDPKLLLMVAGGTVGVIAGAALFKTAQLRSGGPAVAEMVGGRRVDSSTTDLKEKRLVNVVEEMAIASGIPVPAVYVLDDEVGINAFAAGLTHSDAVVAVTRGTLEKLNRDELQGVVAHEFSHILNGDMRLNIRLVAVLFGIFFLTIIGSGLIRSVRFAGGSRNKRDNRIVLVVLAIGLALLVIGYIAYFFGRLIQAAVSRQREFLADASAVQFTRNPGGITGALKKIGGYSMGSQVSNANATAIGHFFFAQGLRSGFIGLFATHPPLDVRIREIDPQFDGKFIEPAETIDISKETFVSAGLVSPPPIKPRVTVPLARPSGGNQAVSAIGTVSPEQVANAQALIDEIPVSLRQAARTKTEATALVYALLLDERAEIRAQQLALLPASASEPITALADALAQLEARHKFPLCQLSIPALRELNDEEVAGLFATIDGLIKADAQVTLYEFTLQKFLSRQLIMSHSPKLSLGAQVYSFNALREPILVAISAMAYASAGDQNQAGAAFARGMALLKTLEGAHELLRPEECGTDKLDSALDQLARAASPIKQRVLAGCAQAALSDGGISVGEAELLRLFSACLDCPMPPLVTA
ncbi:MAG: M48 family metallopeptidase [Nibricoccus sp.]